MSERSKAPSNDAIDQIRDDAAQTAANVQLPNMNLGTAPCPIELSPKPKRARDPELVAMSRLSQIMDDLDDDTLPRVLCWLWNKYSDFDIPGFVKKAEASTASPRP